MTSAVHRLSDDHVRSHLELDPIAATGLGVPGYESRLTDYSPEAHEQRAELARGTLRALDAVTPANHEDEVAAAVLRERLGSALDLHEADLTLSALNVISSPVQDIRLAFTLMETDSADDWALVAARLSAVSEALAGLRRSLTLAARRGRVPAQRQVLGVADQCDAWSGSATGLSVFEVLAVRAFRTPGAPISLVDAAATSAAKAYDSFARFLREELLPRAPLDGSAGQETYRLWSRHFTGARLDQHEAYEWGWAEFERVEAEMCALSGDASPAETALRLDSDPRYQVVGRMEFLRWLQNHTDEALTRLRGKHFDIPDELMRLDCRVSDENGGVAAYYTAPTADFCRPGQVWWTMPSNAESFSTWRELSRVHHEGAPGHHLQEATAVAAGDRLDRFRRSLCDIAAYSEGWALYAEKLMGEQGFLSDRGFHLGMLDGQLLRAARIVVDIGLHLQLDAPPGTGFPSGTRWTARHAHEFLRTRTSIKPAQSSYEVDRYLGWPGQAPSYKLGERHWLTARDDTRRRHGSAFDLKEFHRQALALGPVGLDLLSAELIRTRPRRGQG